MKSEGLRGCGGPVWRYWHFSYSGGDRGQRGRGVPGRIALHSLPQSESFCGRFMEDLGIDPDVEGLRYFEMSEERALEFMRGGDV